MAYIESTIKSELMKKPTVVWITGLSGSGKTTIGKSLYDVMRFNCKSGFLDGDEVRKYLEENKERKYGFSLEERKGFVNNVVYIARNMIEFQKTEIVIISLISPLKEMRDNARDLFQKYCDARFVEVYMDTPIQICEQRDSKGLYKKARSGEIKDFTGIDSPYEIPENPEITISHEFDVDNSVKIIYSYINNEN
jgi:adenylyl-sulfate kinase